MGDKSISMVETFIKAFPAARAASIAEEVIEAVGGIAKLTIAQINKTASTVESAKRLGIDPQLMGGLELAAKMTSVSAEQFGNGLQNFAANVSKAARGLSEESVNLFKELELDPKELIRLSPYEAFKKFGDALAKVNPYDLARLSETAFGKGNESLASTALLGSKGLDSTTTEAKLIGTALPTETALEVQAARSELIRLQESLLGVANKYIVDNVSELQKILGYAADFTSGKAQSLAAREKLEDARQNFGKNIRGATKVYKEGNYDPIVIEKSVNDMIDKFSSLVDILEPLLKEGDANSPTDVLQQRNEDLFASQGERSLVFPLRATNDNFTVTGNACCPQGDSGLQGASESLMLGADTGEAADAESPEAPSGLEAKKASLDAEKQMNQEHNNFLVQSIWEKESLIAQAEKEGQNQRNQFNKMSLGQQTQMTLGHIAQMTQGMANSNKTMFEINKAARLADASIELVTGTIRTWNAYPYPLNIPMTALHVATGVMQIRQLASSSFGGGGKGSVPTGSGASIPVNTSSQNPLVTQPIQQTQAELAPTRAVQINFYGSYVDRDKLAREILPSIEKAIEDKVH